jgi:transposase-like protein
MTEEPKKWDVGTKSAVVLQLLRNERTAQELSLAYGVDVEQILVWKKQVIDRLPTILSENDDPHGCKLRRKSP